LDRFAQFFIAPLFLESTLERELIAIDSENKGNLRHDFWRLVQLNKSLLNPKHPYHRFATGNLQTLRDDPRGQGIDVRSKLIEFHKLQYSANRIKLVVVGRESLDQLEGWVIEFFSGVQNKSLAKNLWGDVPLFFPSQLCTQVFVKPIMDSHLLGISFPFLDEEDLYETLPSQYISHLIGHEGPGSILSYIKAKGWASQLLAGITPICSGSALFSVSVSLTKDGLTHYRDIVKIVFQYIAMIKEQAPEQWIFDEMKRLTEVNFQFKQKSVASQFTSHLSSMMQKPLPREWLLSGDSVLRKFDAGLVTRALSFLRSDNFRLMIVSQTLLGLDAKEKWYGTEYKEEKIPQVFLKEIADALASPSERIQSLHMPHKNDFIPNCLSVKKEVATSSTPKLIQLDDKVRVWFKKDDKFCVPKAALRITLRNSLVWTSPASYVKARLYCELVMDALEEYSYDAELAGLGFSISAGIHGLNIKVEGYNDKMPMLLEKVVSTMCDSLILPERFKVIKERLTQSYRNTEYQQPQHQIGAVVRYLIEEKMWINEQYAADLKDIETEDITAFLPQLLQPSNIEVLAHGNLSKRDALMMADIVKNTMHCRLLPQSQWYVHRNTILPPGSNYIYDRQLRDSQNVNSCIEYYLFISQVTDKTLRAKLFLLAQMIDEPVFDQLRSIEQLGYVVLSGVHYSHTIIGYRICVQSERTALYMEGRIDSFLEQFAPTLEHMTEEDFESHRRSAISNMLYKPENLESETARFWSHIATGYFDFLQREIDAATIETLRKPDMIDFYRQYIDPASEMRAKLSVHLNAQSAETSELSMDKVATVDGNGEKVVRKPVYITNVPQFKAQLPVSLGPSPMVDLSGFRED
jgi:insulysin